ncbi:hypothetical protein GY14_11455 [Delftia tsuruhatensis]|nr:hypothetical protein GY14_11455 [Delftia tsuruhatensis]
MRGALAQRGARQQVDIRVEREDEDPDRAAEAAHLGQEPAFQAIGVAHPGLQRAAELQEVGIGIGRDIGRHGQRQQQQPFQLAPAAEVEQRHGRRRARAHDGRAQRHQQAQPDRGPQVAGQHGGRHLAQDGAGQGIALPQRQPGAEHGQHGQHQHQGQQEQGKGAEYGRQTAQSGGLG